MQLSIRIEDANRAPGAYDASGVFHPLTDLVRNKEDVGYLAQAGFVLTVDRTTYEAVLQLVLNCLMNADGLVPVAPIEVPPLPGE